MGCERGVWQRVNSQEGSRREEGLGERMFRSKSNENAPGVIASRSNIIEKINYIVVEQFCCLSTPFIYLAAGIKIKIKLKK